MKDIVVNFFAGLGMIETLMLIIGGTILGLAIKRADQEED